MGFEPTDPVGPTVFRTVAIDRTRPLFHKQNYCSPDSRTLTASTPRRPPASIHGRGRRISGPGWPFAPSSSRPSGMRVTHVAHSSRSPVPHRILRPSRFQSLRKHPPQRCCVARPQTQLSNCWQQPVHRNLPGFSSRSNGHIRILVGPVGFEPTSPKASRFERDASAVPPRA